MKRGIVGVMLFVFSIASVVGAGDVLQQLGVSKDDAVREVVESVAIGNVQFHRVRDALKKASPEARAAIVEQVLVWTRSFVATPQFAKAYAAYREERKPEAPEARGKAEESADVVEMRKAIAQMPAEYRKEAEKQLAEMIEANKQLQADPEFQKLQREGVEQERREEQQRDAEAMETWKQDYPADPKALLKKRLREFLTETANVDYAAKLTTRNGRQYFANAEYEKKSSEWKLAYRAGKPAVDRARAFAEGWLNEMK